MNTSHISPVWSRITNLTVDHGEGVYIFDIQGDRYLDFTSGIGVTSTGHCHPKIVEAAKNQVEKLIHAQVNIYYHTALISLTEALSEIVPQPIDTFFLSNSGAEGIEGAVKLARHATGRANIIVFQGSFHGRTNQTMAMDTGNTIYRASYHPLASGIFVAPFPYFYRYGWEPEYASNWCLNELRHLLASQSSPKETAAIIIEPIQGEGGYLVPPMSFLQGLRKICDEYDILLIADEVQSGFGRTGKWFGFEHSDIKPDIIVMAKGLASGFPLSCVASRRELMEKWVPGSHGGTYGGNPVSCAAAEATIRVIQDGLLDNVNKMGKVLMDGLFRIKEKYPIIGDVRGLGLMVGTEFTNPDSSPATGFTKAVKAACQDEKLLLLTCGTYNNVIRWIPPLIVNQDQIEYGLDVFEKSIAKLV